MLINKPYVHEERVRAWRSSAAGKRHRRRLPVIRAVSAIMGVNDCATSTPWMSRRSVLAGTRVRG
jgi:hypothetical protein